jgi:glycerophosphoryl diester phosphodiesterase
MQILLFQRLIAVQICTALLVSPPVRGDEPRFEIQAHRGGGIARSENTIETFRWAWQIGVTPEADLRTTKDAEIVCFHDADLARVVKDIDAERKKFGVEQLPLAEVQQFDVGAFRGDEFVGQRIPTLARVFAEMHGKPERRLYLDIKTADLDKLAELVSKYGVESQVIFTTTKYELIRDWKRRVPKSLTLLWNGGTEAELAAKMDTLRKADFEDITHLQIHVHVGDLNSVEPFDPGSPFLRTLGKELMRRGIVFQVLPWECADPSAYEKLLALGARSFATDYPEVTLNAVQTFRRAQRAAGSKQ